MQNKDFQEIKNDFQQFFQDIENGKYGERIKELFMKKESSE
ncbi:MAG: hypothetical protein PPFGHCPK_00919 [Spiroplasma endosymbiont of Drosophila atripex]|nr:MAG: hypothetical protein PPFGHCPK_00197 [Spiroplasma endosymbiont of Drosophila atripex]WDA54018.1 MAG: hypothetical protein PPFGHCPK_00434 [Spiroplasma endosymbiont of Drosophila atripex]WDA54472.1 MAG: hypothetical protein PPFGHCPK_00919 [Spiroplasma endosymbiont of Drosophila atripex]